MRRAGLVGAIALTVLLCLGGPNATAAPADDYQFVDQRPIVITAIENARYLVAVTNVAPAPVVAPCPEDPATADVARGAAAVPSAVTMGVAMSPFSNAVTVENPVISIPPG